MKTKYDNKYDTLYIDIMPDKSDGTQPLNNDIFMDLNEEKHHRHRNMASSKNIVKPVAGKLVEKVKKSLEVVAK